MKRLFIYISLLIVVLVGISYIIVPASNDRNWKDDQKILSYAKFDDNLVTIYNVRNISYSSVGEYQIDYYNSTYDLDKLEKAYYIVEPFEGFIGAAHTFVSFEFDNNTFVSISVEIRKEKDESYSPLKGFFKQYELMYVVGDENDLIKLRTNYRRDDVYMYEMQTNNEKEMFLEMVNRVNDLYKKPEFYNTITNTCTTNLVSHVNSISSDRIPFSLKVLLPEYSAELAYDLELISNEFSFNETKEKSIINEKALSCIDCDNFSLVIRT